MADVRAFRAIRYTPAAGPIGTLAAPPYDVIAPDQRERLAARNARNIVHLILPEGEGERYRLAAERFEGWIRDGYMAQEREPAFYLYRQTFKGPDARAHVRTGFFGLVRLEPTGGAVRHHERTMAKPLEDRLRLLRATRAQLSPIFLLYSDPEGVALRALESRAASERSAPRLVGAGAYGRRTTDLTPGAGAEFNDDDGVRHFLQPICDENAISEVRQRMSKLPVVIADGHHRYCAALEYSERMKQAFPGDDAEFDDHFMLACFVRAEDPGLLVQPTHRVIPKGTEMGSADGAEAMLKRLADRFDVESLDLPASSHAIQAPVPQRFEPSRRVVIGARFAGDPRLHVLVLKDGAHAFAKYPVEEPLRSLDVAVLHGLILGPEYGIDDEAMLRGGRLLYERDAARAAQRVESGEARAAFFLQPVPTSSVFAITAEGLVLPQKSTYFAPKLASGLVLHRLGV